MHHRDSAVLITIAIATTLMSGCASSTTANPTPITGIVERTNMIGGNGLFDLARQNLIKLEGSGDTYICLIGKLPACGLVQHGDNITITAEDDKEFKRENVVVTLEVK